MNGLYRAYMSRVRRLLVLFDAQFSFQILCRHICTTISLSWTASVAFLSKWVVYLMCWFSMCFTLVLSRKKNEKFEFLRVRGMCNGSHWQDQLNMLRIERGVVYGGKDPNLEDDEMTNTVYFVSTRKGSVVLVNWKQRLQDTTKYKAKLNQKAKVTK